MVRSILQLPVSMFPEGYNRIKHTKHSCFSRFSDIARDITVVELLRRSEVFGS
jgi:hypothetical protein